MPERPGERVRVERMLAAARVALALATLSTISLDPALTPPGSPGRVMLFLYLAYSVAVFLVVRLRRELGPASAPIAHAADLAWAMVILFFTGRPGNPVVLVFVFVLVAAAYRWGLRAIVLTAAVAAAFYAFRVADERLRPPSPGPSLSGPVVAPVRVGYIFVLGVLLSYLAHREKTLRTQAAVAARILSRIQTVTGLSSTIQAVADELIERFGARRLLAAMREVDTGRVYLWNLQRAGRADDGPRFNDVQTEQRDTYLAAAPADAWRAAAPRDGVGVAAATAALDPDGARVDAEGCTLPVSFLARHPCRRALVASIGLSEEWEGRLFLLDPKAHSVGDLRQLQALVRQLAPAIYSAYLVRRLRTRAGAIERARVARELHDGSIQSLIGLGLQVDAVRRQVAQEAPAVADELGRIQHAIRQEVLTLRELMQQMRPLDVGPRQLLDVIGEIVNAFGRETGITTRFVSELRDVALPARTCREVAGIVREALVNVRKHSDASHVLVRLAAADGKWHLVIDDDGRGFPFAGRYDHAALDVSRLGPAVIKERVRALGGSLTIESTSHGARLEIAFPQHAPA